MPKRETKDTVQQPGYIYIWENSASHEKGKRYKATTWRDLSTPPTPAHRWEEKNQSEEQVEAQDY